MGTLNQIEKTIIASILTTEIEEHQCSIQDAKHYGRADRKAFYLQEIKMLENLTAAIHHDECVTHQEYHIVLFLLSNCLANTVLHPSKHNHTPERLAITVNSFLAHVTVQA